MKDAKYIPKLVTLGLLGAGGNRCVSFDTF